jgi:hypothetical protein
LSRESSDRFERRAVEARVCERFPVDFCFVLTLALRGICLSHPWLRERIKRRQYARRLKAPDYRRLHRVRVPAAASAARA